MPAPVLLLPTNGSSTKFNLSNRTRGVNKPRIILHSSYDCTDIRPLNKVSPEKLIERSQQLRLSRLSTHSTEPTVSSSENPSLTSQDSNQLSSNTKQKTSLPIIARHQSLSKLKSTLPNRDQTYTKSRISNQFITRHMSCRQTNNNNLHKNNDDEENLPWVMDEEFREYLQKATLKCAEWLIKYDFDQQSELFFV